MRQYTVTLNGKELLVNVLSQNGDKLEFEINGQTYSTAVAPNLSISSNLVQGVVGNQSPAATSGDIKAPMPGIIVNIVKKEGTSVSVGDNLVVIEAMKMENNLTATKSGKIKKVHVKVGQEVQNGQLLITIE